MKKTSIRTVTVSAFMLALLASPSFAKTTVKSSGLNAPSENRIIVKTTTTTVETFDDRDKKKKEEIKPEKDNKRPGHDIKKNDEKPKKPEVKKDFPKKNEPKKFEIKKYDEKKSDLRGPKKPYRPEAKPESKPLPKHEAKTSASAGELLAAGIIGALITSAVVSAAN